MAGKGVELLVSPTEDDVKILASFARIHMSGNNNFVTAVQIAELALRHRKNKSGSQRIIVFVGSPLKDDIPMLEKVGKQLRKNNVAVDIISMGEVEENSEKLTAFNNVVNTTDSDGNNNSHLIVVPPGVIPTDAIASSPVMHMNFGGFGGSGGAASSSGGGGFDDYGGVDPNLDPELAMILRLSAEEARASEEARAAAAINQSLNTSNEAVMTSSPQGASINPTTPVPFGGFGAADDDEEARMLQQTMEASMRDLYPGQENTSASSANAYDDMELDDDAALQAALALSMSLPPPPQQNNNNTTSNQPPQPSDDYIQLILDQGLDINDPTIQAALEQLRQSEEDNKEKEDQNKK